jgi:Transposase DDE domain
VLLACTQDRARSIYEAARDKARAIAKTEAYAVTRRQRQKVEMHFTHLKRILRLDRLRLRGLSGAKDEFLLAATAQNLRELAKLIPLPAPYSRHEAAQLTSPRPQLPRAQIAPPAPGAFPHYPS